MKVVFFGGGSFRTLPIVRKAMSKPGVLDGGEIQLLDLNLERAEAVGRMILASPECRRAGCKVGWTDKAEKALPGADMVSVSMPVGGFETCSLSDRVSRKWGFMASDQLSISGGFRSLTGGRIILGLARKMEVHCPQAWLVCFANPVAVYSGMVNNHTKIRALGVCGGYANHRYDLTRLMGADEYRDDYQVASAGVNHCSVLVRGTCEGRDIYELLAERLGPDWTMPKLTFGNQHSRKYLRLALRQMVELYRRTGYVLFSLEGDGLHHLWPEEIDKLSAGRPMPSMAQIRAAGRKLRENRAEQDAEFRALVSQADDPGFWDAAGENERWLKPAKTELTATIMWALSGVSSETFSASRLSLGAVRGIKDRTVLEYTVTLDKDGITPAPDLEIPDPFHGLMGALATWQTMLGDACALEDPRLFAQAMMAYPVRQHSSAARGLFKELLKVHGAEIAPVFQQAARYW